MAKKKSNSKKTGQEKSMIVKIAGQIGDVAGGLSARKDHLLEMAGGAIKSVKSTIQNITTKKKTASKKAGKANAKKTIKKTARPSSKKPASVAAAKKTTAPKKLIKKATKSASVKK